MPTILTVAQVRQHVESDLGDDALTRIVENADQEIIDRLGALASHTEVLEGGGLEKLPLSRKATSITSAVERILETNYTLAATDYTLLNDGYSVQRLQGSAYPNVRWSGIVTIVFVPADETAARKKLLLDLVTLDCAYDARRSSNIGDEGRTSLDHGAERNSLFAMSLNRNRRMNLA